MMMLLHVECVNDENDRVMMRMKMREVGSQLFQLHLVKSLMVVMDHRVENDDDDDDDGFFADDLRFVVAMRMLWLRETQ